MFRSLFNGRSTGRPSLRSALGVEALDARLVPASFSYDPVYDTASILGTSGDDTITIRHHGDGTVTASDQGGTTVNFANVDRLNVNTRDGNDVVRYLLDGDLETDMTMSVNLEGGNDRFTGTLNRDILNDRHLYVTVFGMFGNDLITMYGTPTAPNRADDFLTDGLAINQNGLRVGTGGELGLFLNGGGDNDRIFVNYRGELDGVLNIQADGNFGDDVVSAGVRLQAGSNGQVGRVNDPATVTGYFGSDDLKFHVYDDSGNYRPVFAEMDGFEDYYWPFETDVGSRTWNVRNAGGLEVDNIV